MVKKHVGAEHAQKASNRARKLKMSLKVLKNIFLVATFAKSSLSKETKHFEKAQNSKKRV